MHVRALPWKLLAPLGLVLGLSWGFLELAEQIDEGDTSAIDQWLVLAMRTSDLDDPVGPGWLEEAARDITALGGHTLIGLLVLVAALYLAQHRRARTALFVVLAVGLGLAFSHLLKLGFDRPRPELVAPRQQVFTSSFPSGHSMGATLTFLTLAALLARVEKERRTQLFLLSVALGTSGLVGLSRVYLGVHWPTDVLGGWTMGTAWALGMWLAADALIRRGLLEGP
jgi:undecaprenyl-diphosphatase